MVQRVKAAQKERDGLQQDKEAAETYVEKELECLCSQSMLAQILCHRAQVRLFWRSSALLLTFSLPACNSPKQAYDTSTASPVQQNVSMIEANLVKLEARLQHEQQKFKEYDEVLKGHEQQ